MMLRAEWLLLIVPVSILVGMVMLAATIRESPGAGRKRKPRTPDNEESARRKVRSVTRILFLTTQIAAIGWVSISYAIAIYSTVRLGQPFPVVELSQQAITTLLGTSGLKVLENIFEHNNGGLWGQSQGQ